MEYFFQIKSSTSELEIIHTALAELEEQWLLPRKLIAELNLILDELITNIIEHGNCQEESAIDIRLVKGDTEITLIVADEGAHFDPTITPVPDISLPLEERKSGGVGIHLVRSFCNTCNYKRVDNKNILTLKKQLPEESR